MIRNDQDFLTTFTKSCKVDILGSTVGMEHVNLMMLTYIQDWMNIKHPLVVTSQVQSMSRRATNIFITVFQFDN